MDIPDDFAELQPVVVTARGEHVIQSVRRTAPARDDVEAVPDIADVADDFGIERRLGDADKVALVDVAALMVGQAGEFPDSGLLNGNDDIVLDD